MVVLVLDHACGKARIGLAMGLEVGIEVFDRDRRRAGHFLVDTRDTQTTLVLRKGIFATLYDTCIDEGLLESLTFGEALSHRVSIDDEEADGTTDLRSSQPDTIGEVHCLPHIFDEGTDTFVIWGNILPHLTQDGMTIYIYR